MPTEITQEMVDKLKHIFVITKIRDNEGNMHFVTFFAHDVEQKVVDRLQTYDMIKDEYTREEMYEFLNHITRLLEMELGTYLVQDLDAVFASICDGENTYGIGIETLAAWFAANPLGREDYINDAIGYLSEYENLDANPDIQDVLQEAKRRETLDVYELGYNFVKWYLGIEEDEA